MLYTSLEFKIYDEAMETSLTWSIAESLTKAIVEHRLMPGTKLSEQKLANHFGVSRTLVRQALFQASQNRLIKLEPTRGAFVATLRSRKRARCLPCAACSKPKWCAILPRSRHLPLVGAQSACGCREEGHGSQ
jgi:DNA-binding transcriptional MocR family regulator